jgi:predicted GNAT family acetyltransferase
MLQVQNKIKGQRGLFYIENEGVVQAEMTYNMATPEHMIIEHTEVGEELRGQNIGYEMVRYAVDYARMHHIKITVVCPFAHSIFKKKPEYADVLYKLP